MKKPLIQWLGLLGGISLISYTSAVVFSPLAYPGYNWMAQAVSDLSATNSSAKMLWDQLASSLSYSKLSLDLFASRLN